MIININGLDIKEAMGGVRVTTKDNLSIRITPLPEKGGFEIFCDVRQRDGSLLQGSQVFQLINGKIKT